MLRYDAEQDALAAVAPDPVHLWPVHIEAGASLGLFAYEECRIAFLLYHQYHARGGAQCARLMGRLVEMGAIRLPFAQRVVGTTHPDELDVRVRTDRLRSIVKACRSAAHHLRIAKQTVAVANQYFGEAAA
jgi:hypothetical protein